MSPLPAPAALRARDVAPHPRQTAYPEPFASMVRGREKRRLGEAFGLSNFGVNLTRLKPGAVSSVRHHHSRQDEFVYVLEGTPTLLTDAGPMLLEPGMCAGFKGGSGNAHQLRNDSAEDVWFLEVGDRQSGDRAVYPDDDLAVEVANGVHVYRHKDGTPFGSASL
jgi:uncharacterized cupin superfamily protein